MKKLAVFASGRGSNFKAIIDHVRMRILENVSLSLLVSNDMNAPALNVAKEHSIPSVFINGIQDRKFLSKQDREEARNEFDTKSAQVLKDHHIDVIALAGFMQVVGRPILQDYTDKIMNIHPALDLIRFGGRGMYGDRVHAAVLRAGETTSGCTVHYVDDSVDGGPTILQTSVPVEHDDTPDTLAHRVLIQEHRTYSKAIQLHVDGRIHIVSGKTVIDWSNDWEAKWQEKENEYVRYQTELEQPTRV
ncbi:MAG TPA: phosphoribosylglycinamide formyltransferase [Methylomirabilota bacterium]|nr:phosphoribosylglycinamide formyltransferase [Methylomirabilota bacterium]